MQGKPDTVKKMVAALLDANARLIAENKAMAARLDKTEKELDEKKTQAFAWQIVACAADETDSYGGAYFMACSMIREKKVSFHPIREYFRQARTAEIVARIERLERKETETPAAQRPTPNAEGGAQ